MTDCSTCKLALKHHKGAGKRDILLLRSLACRGKAFFEPGELLFCPHQIKWLAMHFPELFAGRWAEGREVQFYRQHQPGSGAYFERPIDYAAEIERRLQHCAPDGLPILLHYTYEIDLQSIAKYLRLSVAAVEHRIEVVVWYISGWNFFDKYPYRRDNASQYYQEWQRRLEERVG